MNDQAIVRPIPHALKAEDLSRNFKLASLKRLTRSLEQSATPDETLRALHRGFRETGGFVASMLLSTRGLSPGQFRVIHMKLSDNPQDDVLASANEGHGSVQSGGIVAAIIARSEPQLLQDVDWSRDPFFHEALHG